VAWRSPVKTRSVVPYRSVSRQYSRFRRKSSRSKIRPSNPALRPKTSVTPLELVDSFQKPAVKTGQSTIFVRVKTASCWREILSGERRRRMGRDRHGDGAEGPAAAMSLSFPHYRRRAEFSSRLSSLNKIGWFGDDGDCGRATVRDCQLREEGGSAPKGLAIRALRSPSEKHTWRPHRGCGRSSRRRPKRQESSPQHGERRRRRHRWRDQRPMAPKAQVRLVRKSH